jgi:hypothetical protein
MLEVPQEVAQDAAARGPAALLELASAAAARGPAGLWDSGEWWMLLAAQSMAVGTVMVRCAPCPAPRALCRRQADAGAAASAGAPGELAAPPFLAPLRPLRTHP